MVLYTNANSKIKVYVQKGELCWLFLENAVLKGIYIYIRPLFCSLSSFRCHKKKTMMLILQDAMLYAV